MDIQDTKGQRLRRAFLARLFSSLSPPEEYNPSVPSLYGPLGRGFPAGNGAMATERTITVDSPFQPGRFVNLPLLVPGAVDVHGLARGREPSRDDVGRSLNWATRSGLTFPDFGTIDEATAAARKRSEQKGKLKARMADGYSGH